LQAFYESPTVEGIAANIGKAFSPDAPIVARLRQGQSDQLPLFCIFGVTLYQDLALELAEDRPVFGVHIPFRHVPGQGRRPTLQEIGQRYADLLRRHQTHGPYHLLGLCFGGIVAYEVARQLAASGEPVAAVTVIDAVLPHAIQIDQGKRWLSYLAQACERPLEFQRTLRKRLKQRYKRSRLRNSLQTWLAPKDARRAIDVPLDGPDVEAEFGRFAASPSRLPTRLLVVCATKEPRPEWSTVAPDQGWCGRAETVVLCNVPADHLGVLREPHVRMLAQAVSQISQT
jgi:thioesterase domain-containing protein